MMVVSMTINLSKLDFKDEQWWKLRQWDYTINLSKLDFKVHIFVITFVCT